MAEHEQHPVFDVFAEDFEIFASENAYNALYDRPAVLDLLGDVRGQVVLDVGCGPGLYAEELVDRGAQVVAFDHGQKWSNWPGPGSAIGPKSGSTT